MRGSQCESSSVKRRCRNQEEVTGDDPRRNARWQEERALRNKSPNPKPGCAINE
jgi:hypothetical protein